MTRDEELAAPGRELGRALAAWYRVRGQYPKGPACDQALYEVVGRTFMPFYVAAEETTERPWGQIPAGWSVQHPTDGSWWEIESTHRAEDGRQEVTFRSPKGRSRRPADKLVTCRPPADPDATDAALSAFGDGFEIMEDQIS